MAAPQALETAVSASFLIIFGEILTEIPKWNFQVSTLKLDFVAEWKCYPRNCVKLFT